MTTPCYMRTEIKATNIEITEAIRDRIQQKADMLDRFMNVPHTPTNPIAFVEVEKLTGAHHKKGEVFRCEMMFDLGSKLLRAEKTSVDLYKSIEKVKDEMERQLVRMKEKALSKQRRS